VTQGSKLAHVRKSETSKISSRLVKILGKQSVRTSKFWNSYHVWFRICLTFITVILHAKLLFLSTMNVLMTITILHIPLPVVKRQQNGAVLHVRQ
jgi:hypothetical protein